jgi:tRNA threonylcarbamoyladenosine biosynthesis protein TsaE
VKYVSNSIEDTRRLATQLAEKSVKGEVGPLVFALMGELGAGKTVFVKAFAKALGVDGPVNSPTFILMHPYEIHAGHYRMLYHIDAYRIESAQDFGPIGIGEVLDGNENIVLMEWADRVESLVPKSAIWIHIKHTGETTREIEVSGL